MAPPPPPPPGGYGAPVGQHLVVPASFGSRLGAYLIDGLVLGVPMIIAFLIAVAAVPKELVLCQNDTAICEQPDGTGVAILVLLGLGSVAVSLWYFGNFEGRRGQTIGKKAVNIKLVDMATGEPVGFGRGVGRRVAAVLSGMFCYLGFLWMLWDNDSQTWHDKMINAKVVRV